MIWRRTNNKKIEVIKKRWPEIKIITPSRVRWTKLIDTLCTPYKKIKDIFIHMIKPND